MSRILIFGNSSSGKSTLAQKLSGQYGFAHLDLDTIAWRPTNPPERAPLEESIQTILEFVADHAQWVIEGCYADLLETAAAHADEIVFMNIGIDQCIENARNRPWEPHKYESKDAQDANLEMLIKWIEAYESRTDVFSFAAHQNLYESYPGKKTMLTRNDDKLS